MNILLLLLLIISSKKAVIYNNEYSGYKKRKSKSILFLELGRGSVKRNVVSAD